ncbi:MAG TPA: DUF898 family protein [Scandinavium sp.]|jgi:uncharacterized membrane protein YjgN (DUF898 family)
MINSESDSPVLLHNFKFHGKGSAFFVICLVNLLLTIVTLGIYLPWAFVKSRRYIYENMELNGKKFHYHATGGTFFVSWLLIGILFLVTTLVCSMISPKLSLLPFIVLIILMPLMAVKGLRYQAMMTQLNEVRFGFTCSAKTALWTMLGLPVLLGLAVVLIISGFNRMMGLPESLHGALIQLVAIVVLALVAIGVVNGIIYGKWMQLLGKNARFGIHQFSINVSIKRCIAIFTVTMLILIPFMIVIGKLMGPFFMAFMMGMSMEGMDDASKVAMVMEYQGQIIASYLLYFAGVMLMSIFAMTALRNLFINGLCLGNTLTFRSTVTFVGLLMQILVLSLATMLTCGLAYPWAKMRFIRYLANNTCVVGDLDAIELRDTDEPNDEGFFTAVSRGTMPAIPFI